MTFSELPCDVVGEERARLQLLLPATSTNTKNTYPKKNKIRN